MDLWWDTGCARNVSHLRSAVTGSYPSLHTTKQVFHERGQKLILCLRKKGTGQRTEKSERMKVEAREVRIASWMRRNNSNRAKVNRSCWGTAERAKDNETETNTSVSNWNNVGKNRQNNWCRIWAQTDGFMKENKNKNSIFKSSVQVVVVSC